MAGRVVVVGLGPGDPALLTMAATAAIERVPRCFVRTAKHPTSGLVPGAASFDALYDQADDLDQVYQAIAAAVIDVAGAEGEVLYAVPGSPLVAERSVELLRADPSIEVEILPALSFLDLAWARLGVDPVARGVRVIDGHRFAVAAAGQTGPLLVAQCDSRLVLSDIKLSLEGPDAGPDVTVMQRLGLPDEVVRSVAWADLDRSVEPDHLTCLWIPRLASPVAAELVRFEQLVRTLRARCPWDREQTHHSLSRHLLEETYEVLEAIEALGPDGEGADHLEEELGDLLFQVVFHATLASEDGWFTLADVARGIHDKLVHRHPHVFGNVEADTAGQVMTNWEQIKRAEKGRTSVMEGIPGHLPALLYAHKLQRKAASAGFDWAGVTGAWPKIAEEAAELEAAITTASASGEAMRSSSEAAVADELGDLLFAVVNVARHLDVDPEAALRAAGAKFRDRFEAVERLAVARGVPLDQLDLAGLDDLWNEVKLQTVRPKNPANWS